VSEDCIETASLYISQWWLSYGLDGYYIRSAGGYVRLLTLHLISISSGLC